MAHQVTLTGHPPLPTVPLRPPHNTPAAPLVLWAQLDTTQQHQIAALIAELTRRMATPQLPHEEVTDDHR